MRLLASMIIIMAGVLLTGVSSIVTRSVVNSTAYVAANITDWQTGFVKLIPVVMGVMLMFIGVYMVFKGQSREETME